jgi:hypothetical protein
MELTINVNDYLSEEEQKGVVREAFLVATKSLFMKSENVERVLSNIAYNALSKDVDTLIPNYKGRIVENLESFFLRSDNLKYHIFHTESYLSGKSEGQKILDEAVQANKSRIEDKVRSAVDEFDYTKLVEKEAYDAFNELADGAGRIADVLYKKLNE